MLAKFSHSVTIATHLLLSIALSVVSLLSVPSPTQAATTCYFSTSRGSVYLTKTGHPGGDGMIYVYQSGKFKGRVDVRGVAAYVGAAGYGYTGKNSAGTVQCVLVGRVASAPAHPSTGSAYHVAPSTCTARRTNYANIKHVFVGHLSDGATLTVYAAGRYARSIYRRGHYDIVTTGSLLVTDAAGNVLCSIAA